MNPVDISKSEDYRRVDHTGVVLVAHQVECFPWLGFFSKAAMGDVFFFLDSVQYKSYYFENRNKIRTKNEQGWQWLIFPVHDVKKKKVIANKVKLVEINKSWKKKHLNAIRMSYSKAPFFDSIYPEIEKLYENESNNLSDFLINIIKYGFEKFEINIPVFRTSDLVNLGYDISGAKSELIVNMCKAVNAGTFIFGPSGKTYIDEEVFKSENIKYIFQDFNHPNYKQIHGDFVPYMSFIDILFNNGPESKKILGRSDYSTI